MWTKYDIKKLEAVNEAVSNFLFFVYGFKCLVKLFYVKVLLLEITNGKFENINVTTVAF
jgi:hypothetical protein